VQEQTVPDWEDANAGTEVVAGVAPERVIGQQVEALSDQLDSPIGGFDISRFLEETERDVLEVGFGLRFRVAPTRLEPLLRIVGVCVRRHFLEEDIRASWR